MNDNTTLVDSRKSKSFVNKKIKPIPAGRASLSLNVNPQFEAARSHNNKRWIKIVLNVHITSPVHNNVKVFYIEKELYIENLLNNQKSIDIIIPYVKSTYNDIGSFMKRNMSDMFHGDITPPSDEVISSEVSSFLRTLFFSDNSTSLS